MTDATNADPVDLDTIEELVSAMAAAYPYAVVGQVEALNATLPAVIQELRASRAREMRYRTALERIATHPGADDMGGMDWQAGMVARAALEQVPAPRER